MLESKGVVLSSRIMYAHMRDESGGLTDFKNGYRFLYVSLYQIPSHGNRRCVVSIVLCTTMGEIMLVYVSRVLG